MQPDWPKTIGPKGKGDEAMKGIAPDIAKYCTTRWWLFFYRLLAVSPWIAAIFLILIFFLIAIIVQSQPETWSLWGLHKIFLLGVAGSVLAAALFFVIHTIVTFLTVADKEALKEYYERMLYSLGIKDAFIFRGDSGPTETYKASIAKAKSRVWVFGMSNQSFFQHHKEQLFRLLATAKFRGHNT